MRKQVIERVLTALINAASVGLPDGAAEATQEVMNTVVTLIWGLIDKGHTEAEAVAIVSTSLTIIKQLGLPPRPVGSSSPSDKETAVALVKSRIASLAAKDPNDLLDPTHPYYWETRRIEAETILTDLEKL